METFSELLAICTGNSPITGEFPTQRPVMQSFDVFFDLGLNKQLSKQSWGWRFEMPASSLWHHCNETTHPELLTSVTPMRMLTMWHELILLKSQMMSKRFVGILINGIWPFGKTVLQNRIIHRFICINLIYFHHGFPRYLQVKTIKFNDSPIPNYVTILVAVKSSRSNIQGRQIL